MALNLLSPVNLLTRGLANAISPQYFATANEMPRSTFFNTTIAPLSRDVAQPRPRIPISKEARAVLKASRQQASEKYQQLALHNAYGGLEEQIKDIASVHSKSAQRVRSDLHLGPQVSMKRHSRKSAWNAYCWKKSQEKENCDKSGKEVLLDVVQNAKQEYKALTEEAKENLVLELEKAKATKAKGFHSSARSRINDVTKTLAVIENEIDNLQSRTGIEAMLFITHGSTDTPLTAVSFATSGVEEFIETMFKIDNHEFLARMEGFALQGLKGTASNYKKTVTKQRSAIRSEITNQLRIITGDKDAQMEWKYYGAKIVARYKVKIEGWPGHIPFKNLSVASSPLADLNLLLQGWQDKTTFWKILTPEEVDQELARLKAKGEVLEPPPRRTRSDRGKKQKRPSTPPDTDSEDESRAGSSRSSQSDGNKRRSKRQKAAVSRTMISSDGEDY